MNYRHELKYYISNTDLPVLKSLLATVMYSDPNQGENGYTITSLYFDTLYNRYYDENNAGINTRDKIRIRKYNHSNDVLKLEIKSKENSLCMKESQIIDTELCKEMMTFPHIYTEPVDDTLYSKVLSINHTNALQPAAIIEYDRYAFVHPIGNVRITFDRNIRASVFTGNFLTEDYQCVPVLSDGTSILEVKYDEILPNYIACYLDHFELNQTAFSKYYLGRQVINI